MSHSHYSVDGALFQEDLATDRLRVPIDCADASRTFEVAMTSLSIDPVDSQAGSQRFTPRESKSFGMSNLQIESITCDGYDLAAKVSELHELPFQLRVLGIRTHLNKVEVGTSSFFLAND